MYYITISLKWCEFSFFNELNLKLCNVYKLQIIDALEFINCSISLFFEVSLQVKFASSMGFLTLIRQMLTHALIWEYDTLKIKHL